MKKLTRAPKVAALVVGAALLSGCGDKEEDTDIIAPQPPPQVDTDDSEIGPQPAPDDTADSELPPQPAPDDTDQGA